MPLHTAALKGHQEVVEYLLLSGCDVESLTIPTSTEKSETAHVIAAREGQVAKMLLEFGCVSTA